MTRASVPKSTILLETPAQDPGAAAVLPVWTRARGGLQLENGVTVRTGRVHLRGLQT